MARVDSVRRVDAEPSLLARSLTTVMSASAAPYGYTVTIWSSGALLMHFRGAPKVFEIFLFAAGAITGFWLVGAASLMLTNLREPLGHESHRMIIAGALSWIATGVAIGGVALVAELDSWAAWPAASLLATAVYLGAASLQLALAERARR